MHSDDGVRERVLPGLLYGVSRIYGGALRLRAACFCAGIMPVKTLPCPVISVGNITAGGTGKTPMAVYMADLVRQMGYRPAVLSRGYMGRAEKDGAVVSDGYSIFTDSQTAGDEPVLMACRLRGIPVLVGGDRYKSGMRAAAEFDPDMVILDDGFQHLRLRRDVDLVLIDAKQGLGNGHLLPRGMLREPVSGLRRADAIVLTRSRNSPKDNFDIPVSKDIPVFRADHVPYVAGVYNGSDHSVLAVSGLGESADFAFMTGRRVFAFSGIAGNAEFRDMLESRTGPLVGFDEFPDHYFYTDSDLNEIIKTAKARSADLLATTEKDFVRIAGRVPDSIPVAVVGVRMEFQDKEEEEGFIRFVRRKLAGNAIGMGA